MAFLVLNCSALAHIDVTPAQARDLIGSTEDLMVVDVREPGEYCDPRGHIPGALNYPLNSGVLQARYDELPMEGPILAVCRSGGRSNVAANFLDSKGFTTIYDMMGGMSAWTGETVPCKYDGGHGTSEDPYQIATAADLILLGETPEDYDKHFILTADIDLDPNLPGRRVFDRAVIAPNIDNPIGDFGGNPFSGVFDGNGHTISHLVIKGTGQLGLFGQLDPGGIISNLGLLAVDIRGTGGSIGALVGDSDEGGSISKCYCFGIVMGEYEVGGLVGENSDGGHIESCYSIATVIGNRVIGGLVGSNGSDSSIVACYSDGTVSGETIVGGLVGGNESLITNSYATSFVSGDSRVGGLTGFKPTYYPGREGSTSACFWDMESSGQVESNHGTGLTTTEMQTATTFLEAGWDFIGETVNGPNDVWMIVEDQTYPLLSWQKYGGGTGEPNDPYLIYTAEHLNALGADPNDYDKDFKLMGDIDLSGYTYDRAVIAPDIDDAMPFTGALDGNGHLISNMTIKGDSYLGLFGQLGSRGSAATVHDLGLEMADVNGTGEYIGGLVGENMFGNIVTSYSTGTVCGRLFVGGLVGDNSGSITSSYSTGTVTGRVNVGGLAGSSHFGPITRSYSMGLVSGDQDLGGLLGYNSYSRINSSFWDIDTSGQSSSAGGTGLSTAEMQAASTFLEAGWDFIDETANGTDDIWWIDEGQGYPRLWWEN